MHVRTYFLWMRTLIGTYVLGFLLCAEAIALCCVVLAILILNSKMLVLYVHTTRFLRLTPPAQ